MYFGQRFVSKMSLETLPIEQSVELNLHYPSVSDRYFSHHYFIPKNPYKKTMVKSKSSCMKINGSQSDAPINADSISHDTDFHLKGEDTRIMMHSNRICVVALSQKHPIIVQKKTITKIDFNIGGIDRLSNKVSGKGKRGAQIVGLFSPLCSLECHDGSSYTIYAGIRGKLIEVNDRLMQDPNLICKAPNAEGYLAVVLPKLNQSENLKELLLSHEEYEQIYLEKEL